MRLELYWKMRVVFIAFRKEVAMSNKMEFAAQDADESEPVVFFTPSTAFRDDPVPYEKFASRRADSLEESLNPLREILRLAMIGSKMR